MAYVPPNMRSGPGAQVNYNPNPNAMPFNPALGYQQQGAAAQGHPGMQPHHGQYPVQQMQPHAMAMHPMGLQGLQGMTGMPGMQGMPGMSGMGAMNGMQPQAVQMQPQAVAGGAPQAAATAGAAAPSAAGHAGGAPHVPTDGGFASRFQSSYPSQNPNATRAFHGDRRAGPHPGGYAHGHGGNGFAHGAGGFGGGQHHDPHSGGAGGYVAMPQHVRSDKNEEELFKDHTAGIDFQNYENIEVSVKPANIAAIDSFMEMHFESVLQDNINRCSYTKPTPVQRNGIPVVLAGKDLMACAQTGSGKTAAYLLPAVNHAIRALRAAGHQPPSRTAFPTCLVMAPTRELSVQIYDEGRKFTYRTGVRCCVVYGGADARQQIGDLMRGCNVLVATPGRLWDLFQRGLVKFSKIQFLVLDEADRMLDMGFEPQIRTICEGAETDMPPPGQRQTLLYSATFPKEIQQLAREFLNQHYFLQVGRVGSTTENIKQDLRWCDDNDKRTVLFELLQQYTGHLILIFVEKKRDADYLERTLHQYRINCTSIHGDRIQREREEALRLFKSGQCTVLVATDVAARGLDIPNVSLIIQYDLPSNIDDFVHRIGRTGRAGKTGVAVALFNEKNKNIAVELFELMSEAKQEAPEWLTAMVATMRPQRGRGGQYGRGRGGARGRGYGFGGRGYGGGGGFGGGGFGGHPQPNFFAGHGGFQQGAFEHQHHAFAAGPTRQVFQPHPGGY